MHSKLNQTEREQLARWKAEGISNKECGRRLKRDRSTIGRELKRNRYGESGYEPLNAQYQADERKQKAWTAKQPLKSKWIYSYVIEKLIEGWSPEQIAGRLAIEEKNQVLCHETIYQYIYSKKNKEKKLWEYLPRKQKRRKKQHGRSSQRVHIPNRVSIHERAEEVNQRMIFGHWEGDTIEGKGHKDGIHTEVERISRFLMAERVSSISSEETAKVQLEMFESLPEEARVSTTLDNGRENHLHTVLNIIGMDTYFADPYSSWQRGTNENTNGLVRRYIPKKTPLQNLSHQELQDIVDEINNRPRKVLHYLTPAEVFNLLVAIVPRM